jgi:hypothetical protein
LLTERENKFVIEYLKCRNPEQAYMRAFEVPRDEVKNEAKKLIKKAEIQKEIKNLIEEHVPDEINVIAKDYVNFLVKGAFADIGDYVEFKTVEEPKYNPDGSIMVDIDTGEPVYTKRNKVVVKNSDYLDTSIVKNISNGKDGVKIELYDKITCWAKLQEYFNWVSEANVENNLNMQILEALKGSIESNWEDKDDEYKELHEALKKDE